MRSIARRTAVGAALLLVMPVAVFWLALATWRTKLATKSGFLGY